MGREWLGRWRGGTGRGAGVSRSPFSRPDLETVPSVMILIARRAGPTSSCAKRCGRLSGGEAPMRRIRYSVAMSLDAYIAGPKGESDWIITDPEIDFGEMFNSFDTLLMGRRTIE